jgi:hypothetical protein
MIEVRLVSVGGETIGTCWDTGVYLTAKKMVDKVDELELDINGRCTDRPCFSPPPLPMCWTSGQPCPDVSWGGCNHAWKFVVLGTTDPLRADDDILKHVVEDNGRRLITIVAIRNSLHNS